MTPEQLALVETAASALEAWAKSAPGGGAAFVLSMVTREGSSAILSNVDRELALEILRNTLEHYEGES